MRSLSERDAAALLEVVAELDRLDEPLPFPPSFLGGLARLLDASDASYSVLDRRNRRGVMVAGWCEGVEEIRVGHDESLRTEIWNEAFRDEGVNYWLDMGLPVHHGTTRVFVFTRERRDFGPRERLLLELLEPHLVRRASDVATTSAAVESLAVVADAGDDAHDVVLASARGTIEFASPHSRALLQQYLGVASGTLPESLRTTGTVVAHDDCGRLTVRVARVADLLVLLLGEDDPRAAALTQRQREVLAGVAVGLTDAEIAERLGVAPATVGKHLEAIYERLDVHTRTAAAAVYRR